MIELRYNGCNEQCLLLFVLGWPRTRKTKQTNRRNHKHAVAYNDLFVKCVGVFSFLFWGLEM